MNIKSKFLAVALAAATPLAGASLIMGAATPAAAQAASDADAKRAGAFIDELAGGTFGVIRSGDANSGATKAKLRGMLAKNFDVDYIGQYLIRRHRSDLSDAQFRNYMAVFPDWVVATYTNNLFAFKDSELKVLRAVPAGSRGDIEVYSRVTPPSGAPIDAVWQVRKDGNGFTIRNLKVSGVNLTLTQEQDFNAYINKNGFDALVDLMKRRVS